MKYVHYLDAHKIQRSIKEQGYDSLGDFAKVVGIHRNTLHYYLTEKPLLPDKLEAILESLDLSLGDVLCHKKKTDSVSEIAPVIDRLNLAFPGYTWVLFGSRAGEKNKKYSDWDLGVFSKDPIPIAVFQDMLLLKDELEEDFPCFVDLTDLSRAEPWFLKSISGHLCFLTGSRQGWEHLLQRTDEHGFRHHKYG